eukprot:4283726-Amphidinium_carterae.1
MGQPRSRDITRTIQAKRKLSASNTALAIAEPFLQARKLSKVSALSTGLGEVHKGCMSSIQKEEEPPGAESVKVGQRQERRASRRGRREYGVL